MAKADIVTDYLVVGGGVSCLSFVDELLTRTKDVHITIVDKRDVPGGHWNDTYDFVKLHSPSTFYGVESKELADYQIDQSGPNEGYLNLATGPEVVSYCHDLMKKRFLPSGRVTFLPLTEFMPDGTLKGLLSGKRTTVEIRKKLVDASWYTAHIPLTHQRSFTVESSVTCVPPNELPRLAPNFSNFTILGGGKTGIDACVWLLSNGADPSRLRWVIPNDYWYINRAQVQPVPEFFFKTFSGIVARMHGVAAAVNPQDMAHRHEDSGFWHRLDSNVEPTMFHSATVSGGEVDLVRKIADVIRKGYVKHIRADQIQLTHGSVAAKPNTLYIDCTASALMPKPLIPIFEPGKITLQLVRWPLVPFSCALTAVVESLGVSDEESNAIIKPLPFYKTVDDYCISMLVDMQNRNRVTQHPILGKWNQTSRLDGYARLAFNVRPDETDKIALLMKMKNAAAAAAANMPRLVASSNSKLRASL